MSRIPTPATLDAAPAAALNTWTNYVNGVAQTEIDFPALPARHAA